MAEVLTEVFTGGPEIALRVKEEQVERIFQLVSARGSGQVELMETLQSMAKVRVPPPPPPPLPFSPPDLLSRERCSTGSYSAATRNVPPPSLPSLPPSLMNIHVAVPLIMYIPPPPTHPRWKIWTSPSSVTKPSSSSSSASLGKSSATTCLARTRRVSAGSYSLRYVPRTHLL